MAVIHPLSIFDPTGYLPYVDTVVYLTVVHYRSLLTDTVFSMARFIRIVNQPCRVLILHINKLFKLSTVLSMKTLNRSDRVSIIYLTVSASFCTVVSYPSENV